MKDTRMIKPYGFGQTNLAGRTLDNKISSKGVRPEIVTDVMVSLTTKPISNHQLIHIDKGHATQEMRKKKEIKKVKGEKVYT